MSEILIENDQLPQDQRAHFSRIIYSESIRLTRLLDEILEISRLEHGEMEIKKTPFNPEESIDRAMETCLGVAHQQGVKLKSAKRVSSVEIIGDPNRFHQVLINLLTNAIDYNSSPTPWVKITSRIFQGHYEIDIQDNGPGIQDPKTVFEKFSRGKNESSSKRGTGLGLTISRQLVEKMGGTVELVNNEQSGACFRIKIPRS